jgi:hypothetical protein
MELDHGEKVSDEDGTIPDLDLPTSDRTKKRV